MCASIGILKTGQALMQNMATFHHSETACPHFSNSLLKSDKIDYLFLSTEGSLVNKRDLLALYLSGTYCHRTGTGPLSCVTPRQRTIYTIALR